MLGLHRSHSSKLPRRLHSLRQKQESLQVWLLQKNIVQRTKRCYRKKTQTTPNLHYYISCIFPQLDADCNLLSVQDDAHWNKRRQLGQILPECRNAPVTEEGFLLGLATFSGVTPSSHQPRLNSFLAISQYSQLLFLQDDKWLYLSAEEPQFPPVQFSNSANEKKII